MSHEVFWGKVHSVREATFKNYLLYVSKRGEMNLEFTNNEKKDEEV